MSFINFICLVGTVLFKLPDKCFIIFFFLTFDKQEVVVHVQDIVTCGAAFTASAFQLSQLASFPAATFTASFLDFSDDVAGMKSSNFCLNSRQLLLKFPESSSGSGGLTAHILLPAQTLLTPCIVFEVMERGNTLLRKE